MKSNELSLDHDGLMQIIEYNRSKYRPNEQLDNPQEPDNFAGELTYPIKLQSVSDKEAPKYLAVSQTITPRPVINNSNFKLKPLSKELEAHSKLQRKEQKSEIQRVN